MPALPRTYFDAPAASPSMAGWSEERKRFFMLNGYDRGPTPPETTVKVTETPPDDPTPTKRVTTTKYPEGMEQPGMQGDPYAGLLGGQEAAPNPLDFWQQKGFEQTGVDPDDINLMERLKEQGLYEEDVAGSYDPPDRFGFQGPQLSSEIAELARQDKDPSGSTILKTFPDGTTVSMDEVMWEAGMMLGTGGAAAVTKIPALIRAAGGLPSFIAKNWRTILKIARDKVKGKPTKTKPKPRRPKDTGEVFIGRSRAELDAAAAAGGRGTAGTAGVEAAGGFAPKWTGIKTGLKVATPVAAAGLLDDGMESMPWWFKQGYESLEAALAAGAEFVGDLGVTEKIKELDLGKTTEERELAVAERQRQKRLQEQSFGQPAFERFEGLLEQSPAEVAETTAGDVGQDWDAETKGLLEGEWDEIGMKPWYDSPEAARDEIVKTAGQDIDAKQAELDRYYANFPEDIEGKRERYLKALKEIYKKVAILNVIASLTNSPSQAGAFMQLAAEKFKTLEGFRGEERLQKIARGVFFNEEGVFDAPANKQDAFNRAMRFGANHDEALALSGHKKEYAEESTETGVRIWSNAETGQEIWLPKDQAPTGEGWLPKDLDTATGKDGTVYERIKSEALDFFGKGNIQGAIGAVSAWLQAKDIFERWNPQDADKAALNIIKRWARGEGVTEEEIDAMMEAQPTNIREE